MQRASKPEIEMKNQHEQAHKNRISPITIKVAVSAYLLWVIWEIASGIFGAKVPSGAAPWLAIAGMVFVGAVLWMLIPEWVRYKNKSGEKTL